MKQEAMNEIGYQLNKMVEDRVAQDRYCDEDLVRRQLTEEFAEWLVSKFKEECGYNES